MLAQDWTYDKFVEDMKNNEDEQSFARWFKRAAENFKAKWMETHKAVYDRYDGYVGDAFAKTLYDSCFSDFYKDEYNQRPHLPMWFYVTLTGLPSEEDTARTFCATPIEDAMEDAQWVRENS